MVAETSAISCPILICSDKHALDHTMSRAHFFDRKTSHFRRPFGRLFYFLRKENHNGICGNKTRTKVFEDTIVHNFPLYCPKCKTEVRVDISQLKMTVSK